MSISEIIRADLGLLNNAPDLSIAALLSSLANPLTANTILETALDNGIVNVQATSTLPNPQKIALAIVAPDGTGPAYHFAGYRQTEMHYSADLLKVAAIYAAYQLRATISNLAAQLEIATTQGLFEMITAALDPAESLISSDPHIERSTWVPAYATTFDVRFNATFSTFDFQTKDRGAIGLDRIRKWR